MKNPQTEQALDQLNTYWNNKARGEDADCAKIESGRRAQKMRFENFVINHELAGKSILDIGCGVGDFWEHLQQRGISTRYMGIDLSEAMLERAQQRFPEGCFEWRNVLEWAPSEPFDYTASFAIHNVRVDGAEQLLRDLTRRQFELCQVAAHVSILTDRYPGFDAHIMAWKAEKVLAMALEITPYVVLRHHYLPNDFSITLYRQPVIDTHPGLILA